MYFYLSYIRVVVVFDSHNQQWHYIVIYQIIYEKHGYIIEFRSVELAIQIIQ